MSTLGINDQGSREPEFQFWDFVSCGLCHLPYAASDREPPLVPFWITECGHVVCNNHLNPDQSCAKCGEQGIQLMPLQRDLEPPMSDWFRSLPHAMDSIANAVKFQQDSLATLVRHWRSQALHFSTTCDRLRSERKALRKQLEGLQRENDQLRQYASLNVERGPEPSSHLNHNGKRPMTVIRGQSGSIKTNSSPRSVVTPVGPLRLTLPPGEHPSLNREPSGQSQTHAISERPGSSRFAEQYAYNGEATARMGQPSLTHGQTLPLRYAQANASGQPYNAMPPPSVPTGQAARFKPVAGQHARASATTQVQNQPQHRIPKTTGTMGPPPTPQRPFSRALQTPSRASAQNPSQNTSGNRSPMAQSAPALQSNRFIPGPSHGLLSGPTTAAIPSAKVPASKFTTSKPTGGQRMPFMPGSSSGFG
ncbi:hypothetical protein F5I97DRAFT_1994475 [Phlebopus sp. FC_14]|nr:hypothetical protein F5I97DRAFT_1994475 [Phlebopus sp. FC_14]